MAPRPLKLGLVLLVKSDFSKGTGYSANMSDSKTVSSYKDLCIEQSSGDSCRVTLAESQSRHLSFGDDADRNMLETFLAGDTDSPCAIEDGDPNWKDEYIKPQAAEVNISRKGIASQSKVASGIS